MLVIFEDLDHDLQSLALTCWTAATRVIQLAAERVTVDITRTTSTEIFLKLLAAYRHQDTTLKVKGSSDYISKQLAAMQAVAPCVGVVSITLTVHSADGL
jgi:hypothetical protein